MSAPESTDTEEEAVDVTSADAAVSAALTTSPPASTAPETVRVDVAPARRHDGRYVVEKSLGRGGMGEVVLCFDRVLSRRVARKSLHSGTADRLATARFVREALVQGQLEHPSIVPVHDLDFDASGAPWLTMKRVRGRTLRSILHARRDRDAETLASFPLRRLLQAFATVCQAVSFAHSRGVIHRDLKPDNVMLGSFGEVYVLDWGVAKLQSAPELPAEEAPPRVDEMPGTEAGAILGTAGYMPPEQVRGQADQVDARADVYALGAILFEILADRPLHAGDGPRERMLSTLGGADARVHARAPDRDVPPELEAICVRATARSPADRFPSVSEMHAALDRYLSDDRDVELRREMASVHARNAAQAAERALAEGGEPDRRDGLREAGRALALDPSNEVAMQTMVRLLTEPPAKTPPEVERRMTAERARRIHYVTRIGMFTFAALAGYIPVMLWMGVRSFGRLALLYLSIGAFLAGAARILREREPGARHLLLLLVLSNLVIGMVGSVFGPLILVPGFAALNIISFVLTLPRRRALTVAAGTLPVLVPGALQVLDLLPRSYAFGPDGMTVLPRMLELPAIPTLVFFALTSLGMIVGSGLVHSRFQQALDAAERKLFLQAWQLQQVVSPAARPPEGSSSSA